MKSYLLQSRGWSESDITVLSDAKGSPEHLLPTHANIMREITMLCKSSSKDILFLYAGHSDQRPQPKQSILSGPVPKGAPGRQIVEEFDQFIIPIDAVTGPELTDIDQDFVILDDVLHKHLISTLHTQSSFLAILDTCHSETLLDLKHHHCSCGMNIPNFLRRTACKVIVEPLGRVFGRATGGLANISSFNIPDFSDGFPLETRGHPIAATISARKDQQSGYETNPSLTETIVKVLRSKPTTNFREVINSVRYHHEVNDSLKQRVNLNVSFLRRH
ncbi:hypothetical protein BKA70DRAFT_295283 [Coprinopsis sp. MPI-PUGE-AT-0042]|nr:hypothetical protein BKA70DRAFT_295283 [Coprinopsis sp. MPI-PUGE-AT-0042]